MLNRLVLSSIGTARKQVRRPKYGVRKNPHYKLSLVDNDIETTVSVKFATETPPVSDRPSPTAQSTFLPERPTPMDTDQTPHGQTEDGEPAGCRATSDGVIDCEACLHAELADLTEPLNDEQRLQCENVLDVLGEAGSNGLSKAGLAEKVCFIPLMPPSRTVFYVLNHR